MTPPRHVAVALLAGIALVGCTPVADPHPPSPPSDPVGVATAPAVAAPTATAIPEGAHATLDRLEVKGHAPKTGYDRALFGDGWLDLDGDGCDTRQEILRDQLRDVVLDADACRVLSGRLDDPLSGTTIAFTRGPETSFAVQVDHVVPLSDAWQKGAQQWDAQQRAQFANDPANLLAVDGVLNGQKSDGDAATWLPPNKAFRCGYVEQQIAVKAKWGLWVTGAERDAMTSVLAGCDAGGGVQPPSSGSGPVVADEVFANCAAARAAGRAPVSVGDPGWGPHLDGDGDGVGCE